jgi:hypothetical protein
MREGSGKIVLARLLNSVIEENWELMLGSAPGVSELESGDGSVHETRAEGRSRIVSGWKSAFPEDVAEVGV